MIPLHFAALSGYGGPSYVISFACGAMLINVTLWALRYLFELYRVNGSVGKAYYALPSFHVRELWYLGGLSGLLWSMGNFASIVSVTLLGQGIGYSFTQSSMLVSGLWYVDYVERSIAIAWKLFLLIEVLFIITTGALLCSKKLLVVREF